jgi:hypothetical protein
MATTLVGVSNMALGRLGTHQFISSFNDQTQLANTIRTYFDQARRACLAEYDWPFAKVFLPLTSTGNNPPPKWQCEYARPQCLKVRSVSIQCPPPPVAGQNPPSPIPSGTASYIDFGGPVLPIGGPPYQGLGTPNIASNPSPTAIPFETGSVMVPQSVPPVTGGAPAYVSGSVMQVIWTNLFNAAAWCTIDVTNPDAWEPGFINTFSWFLAAEIAVNVTGSAAVQQAMMEGAAQALSKATATEGNEETQVATWNADWIDARTAGWGGGYAPPYGDGN